MSGHIENHAAPGRDGPLFTPSTGRGRRLSQTAFDRYWRDARKVSGRDSFRFHTLRHTGLTEYARHGATLADLLERGGHTGVSVALKYQHASAQRDRELTSRLDDVVTIPASIRRHVMRSDR